MWDQILELIRSSLPEALGGIIAASVLAIAGGIWAYTRRKAKSDAVKPTPPGGSSVRMAGAGFEAQPDTKVDASLYRGKTSKLGAVEASASGKLKGGVYMHEAYTDGQDLRMEDPLGAKVEVGPIAIRKDAREPNLIEALNHQVQLQTPRIDQYLESSSWISSTRRNELKIGSDFLLWDQCTLMVWVLVPPLGENLRDAPHYRYLLAHHTGDAEDWKNYNAFALRYTPDHHWEILFSNNKARYPSEALGIDDSLEPGWHHFLIAWDHLRPELVFLIDRGRRGSNRSGTYLAYWPERLSESVTIGAWMPAYEDSYCDTKLYHLWICDRFLRPTDPIAGNHFHLLGR